MPATSLFPLHILMSLTVERNRDKDAARQEERSSAGRLVVTWRRRGQVVSRLLADGWSSVSSLGGREREANCGLPHGWLAGAAPAFRCRVLPWILMIPRLLSRRLSWGWWWVAFSCVKVSQRLLIHGHAYKGWWLLHMVSAQNGSSKEQKKIFFTGEICFLFSRTF
jgi:hypothetical protein